MLLLSALPILMLVAPLAFADSEESGKNDTSGEEKDTPEKYRRYKVISSVRAYGVCQPDVYSYRCGGGYVCPDGTSCVSNYCCNGGNTGSNTKRCPDGTQPSGRCSDDAQCGSADRSCWNGGCCRKTTQAQVACGGKPSVAACFSNGKCGAGLSCVNGYCCKCPGPNPADLGPCNTQQYPTNNGCSAAAYCRVTINGGSQQSGVCCVRTGTGGGGACPLGAQDIGQCYNNLCPLNSLCYSGRCCRGAVQTGCASGVPQIGACLNGLCPVGYDCYGFAPANGQAGVCCAASQG